MPPKKQNIWIIDSDGQWPAEVELALKRDTNNITRFSNAAEAYSELDMLKYSNNGDDRPDVIIAFSLKSSVPYPEELFNRAEQMNIPAMLQDYRTGDYTIHTKVDGKVIRFDVPEVMLTDLPSLVDKVVAEASSQTMQR